jgi:hypothetical protein
MTEGKKVLLGMTALVLLLFLLGVSSLATLFGVRL